MTKVIKQRRFYRSHDRLVEHGEMVDINGVVTRPPSMTKQEFQAECDINNIVKHFSATGSFRHVSGKASEGAYRDLPDGQDFQEALHVVQAGQAAFMTLPAKLRSRFGNEPEEFLAFAADPANADEMRSLGIANPLPSAPAPIAVTMVDLESKPSSADLSQAKKDAARRDD